MAIKRATTTAHTSPTYDQLERVRNILNNACCSPLPNPDEQATVVLLLEQVRAIYRAAWDREGQP